VCCRSSGRWQTRPAAPIGVRLRRRLKLLQKRPDAHGCSRTLVHGYANPLMILMFAKLMESPKALKMLHYGHIHATRSCRIRPTRRYNALESFGHAHATSGGGKANHRGMVHRSRVQALGLRRILLKRRAEWGIIANGRLRSDRRRGHAS
jgi:hypothetical protein